MIRRLLAAFGICLSLGLLLAVPVGAATETPSPSPAVVDTPVPLVDASAQDRVSFGSNIHIGPGEVVRDVFCFGCSVVSEGTIARDLTVFGGNADIRGPIQRDAFVLGGRLHLGPHASVGRDLNSVGGSVVEDPGATVGRDKTVVGNGSSGGFSSSPDIGGPNAGSLVPAVVLVILAALAMAIFPRQLAVTASLVEARPFASFGLGCLGCLGGIALAILLAITVILIPVSFLIILAIALAWIFGWAAIYLVAGSRLLKAADQRVQPFLAVLVGGAVFALLSLIPLVAIPLGLLGGSIALGAALGSRFGTRSEQGDFFGWGSGNRYGGPPTAMAPVPPPVPPPPAPATPTPPPPQEPGEGNT